MGLFDRIRDWAFESEDDVSSDEMLKALKEKGIGDGTAKGIAQPTDEPPRGLFHDPYAVHDWGGWRQRPSALTYETLREMARSNTVIAAIIQTRVNQVSQFCRPQQGPYDKGYRVILRDRRGHKAMTGAEQKRANEIERMLETTGFLLPDEKATDRDSFRTFIKKSVRDVLTYDQWCHPAGTLVQMADGSLRPIESIQPGERVITHQGRVQRVTEVMSRAYTGRMVRLRYRGQELVATEGHPVFVERDPELRFRKGSSPEWVEAGAVEEGQYLVAPEVLPFGAREDLLSKARVLGLYAGDGHRSGTAAVWTFHEDEQDLVDAVLEVFPDARIEPYTDRAAVSVRVLGEGEWFASRCGEGSDSKRVPHEVLHGSLAVRRAFLRGYLEADGHLKSTSAVISTTSLALRGGVSLLAAMDGMFISWSETANVKLGWSPCWQGRLSGAAYREFAARAGLPVADPSRSREPCLRRNGRYFLRVNQTEHFDVEDAQVFNLHVEEDESYIANGVVTHNCFEKQRDRAGRVSRFIALPSATIRPAVADYEHMSPKERKDRVAYVQIYESSVIAEFGFDDLAWCIMNPRSDLLTNGFGYSPVEQIIRLVTSWLFGFDYNTRFFTQGSAVKGLINIKGAVPERQMRAFRRQWYSMVTGVQNAWKTPILNADDVQWLSMHSANREMEYGNWMDWLTKLIAAVYGVDPIEINFQFGNTGQSSSLGNQNNEEKITESKDKGLRPLIDHLTDHINQHLIWDLDEDFEFSFVGLDAKAEQAERDARLQEVTKVKMIDEIREEMGLEALPDELGKVVLDAQWIQFYNGQQAQDEGLLPDGTDPDADQGMGDEDDFDPFGGDDDDDGDPFGSKQDEDGSPKAKGAQPPPQGAKVPKPGEGSDDAQKSALTAALALESASMEALRKSERWRNQ